MNLFRLVAFAVAMGLLPLQAFSADSECVKADEEWRPSDGLALVTDTLSKDMWFSTGTLRTKSAVMQSFDIDFEKNLIYYSQLNSKYRLYISWSEPNSVQPQGSMELHYFGHGSNFSIEKEGDKPYLWISNYGSRDSKDDYWDSQIISRVPIEDGAVLKPWDCTDNYYFGEPNMAVAVDVPGDRMAVLFLSSRTMRTYKLSELKALPVETVELAELTYGGAKAPDAETRKVFEVQARDCSKVKPLGEFKIERRPGVAWQGFDVDGDVIYQAQGNGNDNDGKKISNGNLLIFKIDGTPILPPTYVEALANLKKLADWGITDTGYMEPEGVKIRNGAMYCGYASKNSANERRGTIFKYSPRQVKAME